jgi:cytochrome c553
VRNRVEKSGGTECAATAWRKPGKRNLALALIPLGMFVAGSLSAAPPPVDPKKTVKEVCAACHTETGNSAAPPFPRLSGMGAEYLAKQLRDISSGARKSEIMYPIVIKLNRNEIDPLADYFEAQARTPGIVSNPKLIAQGEALFHNGNPQSGVPACAGCHQPNGAGVEPRFPMLASQNADYVVSQLQNFRSGARANDYGLLMRTVAGRLSDQEIQAVAQYVASMPVVKTGR